MTRAEYKKQHGIKYREKYKDKIKAQSKEYYLKNRDKIKKYTTEYSKIHRIRRREIAMKWQRENKNTLKTIYKMMRCRSRIKDRLILPYEVFVKWYDSQEKVCVYCGVKENEMKPLGIESGINKNYAQIKRLTIDRVDPKVGYLEDNIVLACILCNRVKAEIFSFEEMKRIGREFIRKRW